MALILPRLISCDEAGFTGNHLLDPHQRYFAFASHDLSASESEHLLSDVRAIFNVQMPELKAHKLLKSAQGRRLLEFVLDRMDGRYIATLYDKRLALCCKVFEYIYEPVLQANNKLFYDNNLHRFVAMFLYMHTLATPASMSTLADEFETFMRSLDPADAPTLFGADASDGRSDYLLALIRRFARGFNVVIARGTRDLRSTPDQGKWILDLSLTALNGHLVAWGERHPLLEVLCDDSKPLRSLAGIYDVMINRQDHPEINIFGKPRRLTWNMSGPIRFAASNADAGLQLSDLIAGCTVRAPDADENEALRPIAARIGVHLHDECLVPDMSFVDPESDEAAVNFLILYGLAERAKNGEDPLEDMAAIYHFARKSLPSFRAGEFDPN